MVHGGAYCREQKTVQSNNCRNTGRNTETLALLALNKREKKHKEKQRQTVTNRVRNNFHPLRQLRPHPSSSTTISAARPQPSRQRVHGIQKCIFSHAWLDHSDDIPFTKTSGNLIAKFCRCLQQERGRIQLVASIKSRKSYI